MGKGNEWCCEDKSMIDDCLKEMGKFPEEQKALNIQRRLSADGKTRIFVPSEFTESFVNLWHKTKSWSRQEYERKKREIVKTV